jgi:hypothetical protein
MAGLITYLLLAIYCHETHNEKVSIKRVRELRTKPPPALAGGGLVVALAMSYLHITES